MARVHQIGPFLALLFPFITLAQFITPPTDLTHAIGHYDTPVRYKLVPNGTCELTPDVRSYAGFVDISEHQHIFFWFFEARESDPHNSDLTVWLNGGPGSTSMFGLFQEMGPCRLGKDGQVVDNPFAWNRKSNLLFIDQPVQTGFSYSDPIPAYQSPTGDIVHLPDAVCPEYAPDDSCGTFSTPDPANTPNSTLAAAPAMWRTLQGFTGAFPQYATKSLHFTTESYGGHWGPIFSQYILDQNALLVKDTPSLHGAVPLHLKTLVIVNGWLDAVVQYPSFYNFTVDPGNTYDYRPFNESIETKMYRAVYDPGNCYDQLLDCQQHGFDSVCKAAHAFCVNEVEIIFDITMRDDFDIRELKPDPFPPSSFTDYLATPDLQAAIGAHTNFSEYSNVVGMGFDATGDDARELGIVDTLRGLVEQGVYVMLFAGDADLNCNWLGVEAVADLIAPAGWEDAGYANISTSDDIVHGQVKQAGKFAFARIYNSGHEVPFYQPLVSLEMFERTMSGRDIEKGKKGKVKEGYRTKGTVRSEYREGNGTMQFEVLDADSTYNTTLNGPDVPKSGKAGGKKPKGNAKRSLGSRVGSRR